MAKYREKFWLLCTLLVLLVVFYHSLTLLRQDARVLLEGVMAGSSQDRSMGELAPMLSRRDVRGLLNLVESPLG